MDNLFSLLANPGNTLPPLPSPKDSEPSPQARTAQGTLSKKKRQDKTSSTTQGIIPGLVPQLSLETLPR